MRGNAKKNEPPPIRMKIRRELHRIEIEADDLEAAVSSLLHRQPWGPDAAGRFRVI
jgi:hypothetical protein